MTVLNAAGKRKISTICTGVCAEGNSAQSVIEVECKDLDGLKPEWIHKKDGRTLTVEKVNTIWEEECTGCKQWKTNQTDAAIKSCNYENGTKFNPEPEDTIPSGSKCELHCKVPLILFPSLFYDKNCRTQGRPWMKPDSSF